MADEKPICFIISPIGQEGSETRKRSDKVLRHLIERAADACGYKALRADKMSDPGMITSQVIQHIIEDPMVIADLSDHNANVFYELAIRHALRKPYVQVIDKGFTVPFDLSVTRTVIFDLQDPDVLEASRSELINHIKAVEGKNDVDSPISNAIDVEHMRRSGSPEQRQLAELMTSFAEVKRDVQTMTGALSRAVYLPSISPALSILDTVRVGSPWSKSIQVDDKGVVTVKLPDSLVATNATFVQQPARTSKDDAKKKSST